MNSYGFKQVQMVHKGRNGLNLVKMRGQIVIKLGQNGSKEGKFLRCLQKVWNNTEVITKFQQFPGLLFTKNQV